MIMIKIEFPSHRKDIALAIGQALTSIGTGTALVNSPAPSTAAEVVTDLMERNDAAAAEYNKLDDLEASNEMADNSHIEAKIPTSKGGTMGEGDDVPPPPPPEGEHTDPKGAAAAAAGSQGQTAVTQQDGAAANTTAGDAAQHVEGVTLDKAGLPWDVRIHAATKTTKADETWKRKVRVSDELVQSVETELRAALAATPPPPEADPSAALAGASTGDEVPPPPADGPEKDSPTTFPQLLPLVSAAKANGTITDDEIAVAVAAVGLTKFGELAVRPDLIPKFAEAVGV
jgi:hypothetical protein